MSAQGDFDFRELCVSSTVPRLLRHGTLAGRHAEVPAEHCVYWAVPVARRTTVGSGPFGDDVWRPGGRDDASRFLSELSAGTSTRGSDLTQDAA